MSDKEKYSEFCSNETELPVFYQSWWLNKVCVEGNWDVLLFKKNSLIVGAYPFFRKKKYNVFSLITMPPYTPFLGPYLKYPDDLKNYEKISYEKEILNFFIDKLPDFDLFIQFFNYNFSNWLPFFWNNFSQTTYYSYIIENISDPDKVRSNFHSNKQQEIKKALKTITTKLDLPPEEFYRFHKGSLEKQNQKINYTLEFFLGIFNEANLNNSGKIIFACDNERIYSAIFFVWDKISGYNLITVNDPDYKKSGALSLLILRAIEFLSDKVNRYDLEGSMIENYEFSYRQFGGIQQQYFHITKTNSFLLKAINLLNTMWK